MSDQKSVGMFTDEFVGQLKESKFPSYNPFVPLEESTGIKVEGAENVTLEDLAEMFVILANSAERLDINGFMIAYHIVMGPEEALKKSEVVRLKIEHKRLNNLSYKLN